MRSVHFHYNKKNIIRQWNWAKEEEEKAEKETSIWNGYCLVVFFIVGGEGGTIFLFPISKNSSLFSLLMSAYN